MKTEQIDLSLVKRLIDNVWELKKQVQILTQQLDKTEKERNELQNKVTQQESSFANEISELKQSYQITTESTAKENQEQISSLTSSYNEEKQRIIDDYEEKIAGITSELKEENDKLSQNLQRLSLENRAIINRIRGIE